MTLLESRRDTSATRTGEARMMNTFAVMFAAPAAKAALGLARSGAAAAAEPFEMLLRAAAQRAENAGASSNSPSSDENDEGESIRQRLAGKLQEIMAAMGVAAGDVVTLRFDETTGGVEVGDEHPLAGMLEAEIADDPQIAADLARLADMEGDDPRWQFQAAA
jgi:hypothetical protein